jgi:hypothetical protein
VTVAGVASNGVNFTVSSSAAVLLGDQNVESFQDTDALGQAEAFQTTASASGTLAFLSIYIDSANTVGQLTVGLYTSSRGHPPTLLTQASTTAIINGAWNKIAIPAVNISSGAR